MPKLRTLAPDRLRSSASGALRSVRIDGSRRISLNAPNAYNDALMEEAA